MKVGDGDSSLSYTLISVGVLRPHQHGPTGAVSLADSVCTTLRARFRLGLGLGLRTVPGFVAFFVAIETSALLTSQLGFRAISGLVAFATAVPTSLFPLTAALWWCPCSSVVPPVPTIAHQWSTPIVAHSDRSLVALGSHHGKDFVLHRFREAGQIVGPWRVLLHFLRLRVFICR